MADKIKEFVDEDGMIHAEDAEQEQELQPQRIEKPRVVPVLFLGGSIVQNKEGILKGVNLLFVDSVQQDRKTGQPVINGFNPIISTYIKEGAADYVDLIRNKQVFSKMYIKISGNENFTRLHGILTPKQVEAYVAIMDGLV